MAHTPRIGRTARGMVSLVTLAGGLVVGGSSAQAAGPGPLEPGRYRTAYESATVSSLAPDANGLYTGNTVSLFRNDDGTHLCVDNIEQAIDGGLIINAGCAPLDASAFQLDKQLTGVTLAPTSITVTQSKCDIINEHEAVCTELGPITLQVAATIDGAGALEKTRSRSAHEDDTYTYRFKGSGSYRMATGTVTVNDETESGTGSLATSTHLIVVRAK